MPKLVVIQGLTTGLEHIFRGDVLLGRDPKNQIVSADREVSARHVRLTRVGEQYFVEDLGSRNGTYVNGERTQRQALNDGDELTVGRTTYRFEAQSRGAIVTTDPGSMTVELDATQDLFKLSRPSHMGGVLRTEHTLKLLCDVSRSIGALAGLKTTLDEIASTLLEVFPQCGRVIVLLSADGVSLEPVSIRWRSEQGASSTIYSETIVLKARSEKRAILTVDASSDARFAASRSVVDLNLRSVMCAPIVHRDRVLGVVELDTLEHSRMFSEADLNLLTGIVAQLAFAVANAELYDELSGIVSSAVTTLTTLLGFKSQDAFLHSERVSRYAMMIARRLEMPSQDVETLRQASLLHDIGLLTVNDSLLKDVPQFLAAELIAEGEQNSDRRRAYSSHPEKAAELLSPIKPLSAAVNVILGHHEHFDGSGQPRGLIGDQIVVGARILAVADAFDLKHAMAGGGDAAAASGAIEHLKAKSGSWYDPEIVGVFERIWEARVRLEARRQGEIPPAP